MLFVLDYSIVDRGLLKDNWFPSNNPSKSTIVYNFISFNTALVYLSWKLHDSKRNQVLFSARKVPTLAMPHTDFFTGPSVEKNTKKTNNMTLILYNILFSCLS